VKPADRHLNEHVVVEIVRDQFPDIDVSAVGRIGEGWDNEVYAIGEWIFRFPRHAEVVPWLEREIELMSIVERALSGLVPHFEKFGTRSERFPYPFVGYRRLQGLAVDDANGTDVEPLAVDIADAFSRLHSIDTGGVPPTPAGWENETWEDWRSYDEEDIDDILEILPETLVPDAEPFLRGKVPPPPFDGPRRFVHNDICADHVLVDPRTGNLTGLLDFGDAMVGDSAGDFVGLITIGGYAFIDRTLGHYRLPIDETFRERIRWAARNQSLHWLSEVLDEGNALNEHLLWVERAFAVTP
jgi:aminoglycoside 2''-phosphotransferase